MEIVFINVYYSLEDSWNICPKLSVTSAIIPQKQEQYTLISFKFPSFFLKSVTVKTRQAAIETPSCTFGISKEAYSSAGHNFCVPLLLWYERNE